MNSNKEQDKGIAHSKYQISVGYSLKLVSKNLIVACIRDLLDLRLPGENGELAMVLNLFSFHYPTMEQHNLRRLDTTVSGQSIFLSPLVLASQAAYTQMSIPCTFKYLLFEKNFKQLSIKKMIDGNPS